MSVKRLSLLTALALAVVAYAAVPASADILSPGSTGSPYVGPIKGLNTGDAPTLTAGATVITCQVAETNGEMDGNAPATAVLNFSWDQCQTQTAQGCTVEPITGVDVAITEENNPSATIRNTGHGGVPGAPSGTTITCAGVFVCDASSDPDTRQVSAEVDQATQVATIDDTVTVTGSPGIGCPLSGTGQWEAQYQITDDADQDLDLWATGP